MFQKRRHNDVRKLFSLHFNYLSGGLYAPQNPSLRTQRKFAHRAPKFGLAEVFGEASSPTLFLLGRWLVFYPGRFLRQTGGEFFILNIVDAKRAEHVIGVAPRPILVRITVSHLCRASLFVLVVQRIRARRVYNFRRTTHAAFDKMPMERAILPNRDLMFFALDFASDWCITRLRFLRHTWRQHRAGDGFQCFSLLRVGILVDVVICKVPIAVRFHHRLTLWTLAHCSDSQSVEFCVSVIAFFDEQNLAATTSHFSRFGVKPTWTCGITRAGFFELTGNLPWRFIFWLMCSSQRKLNTEHTHKRTQPERGRRFHGADFIMTRAIDKSILIMVECESGARTHRTPKALSCEIVNARFLFAKLWECDASSRRFHYLGSWVLS